jgi:hypothetical protein
MVATLTAQTNTPDTVNLLLGAILISAMFKGMFKNMPRP